jgi:hypothetical protein
VWTFSAGEAVESEVQAGLRRRDRLYEQQDARAAQCTDQRR